MADTDGVLAGMVAITEIIMVGVDTEATIAAGGDAGKAMRPIALHRALAWRVMTHIGLQEAVKQA